MTLNFSEFRGFWEVRIFLILGWVFGRTDFARIYFWAAGIFCGFCRRIFSPHFCGEKRVQKNHPPGKSPAKSSKIYTTKIPDTFLQRGRAKVSETLKPLQNRAHGNSKRRHPWILQPGSCSTLLLSEGRKWGSDPSW